MRPVLCAAARTLRLVLLLLATSLLTSCLAADARADEGGAPVVVAHLRGAVDPVSARYLRRVLAAAEREHATALVLTIDTPGGLDSSMRQMVQGFLSSPIPTVAFVWPPGARDASAGVFITAAANVVAMAPGTSIGAAHPVAGGGENLQGDLRDKVTNEAAAYIAGIARQRGRNEAWLQEAVRTSVSLDAQGAVDQHVADLLAADLPALLGAIDGRTVITTAGEVTIRTAGAPLVMLDMNAAELLFQRIVDPTVAYLLLLIGFYALLIELFHPGALVPGFTGAVCLILAFAASAALPLNWAGVLLLVVALALFVIDVKAATHGALTIAGLACLVLGSLLLYNPPGPRSPALPVARVAPVAVVAIAVLGAGLSALVVGAAVRVARRPPLSAVDRLAGATGLSSSALDPRGTVRVGGQLWSARLRGGTLGPGQPVRVLRRQGLTLEVEPLAPAGADGTARPG